MYSVHVLRRRAAAALCVLALGAGLALNVAPAKAAVFTDFDANATVDLRLLSALPSAVQVTAQTAIQGRFFAATGDLSSASSDPLADPLTETPIGQFGGLYLSHSDLGQAGASRAAGVMTGSATADSQSDGLIHIENNRSESVDLTFEWDIDALAAVGLSSPTGADSAGASAFVQMLLLATDGLMDQVVADITLNALLDGTREAVAARAEQFVVSVPAGGFRDLVVTLESGGTSHVVPVPPSLALLALGLLGLRAQRTSLVGACGR